MSPRHSVRPAEQCEPGQHAVWSVFVFSDPAALCPQSACCNPIESDLMAVQTANAGARIAANLIYMYSLDFILTALFKLMQGRGGSKCCLRVQDYRNLLLFYVSKPTYMLNAFLTQNEKV